MKPEKAVEGSQSRSAHARAVNGNLKKLNDFQVWSGADNVVVTVAYRILSSQRSNSDSVSSRKQRRAVKIPIQHLQ